MRGEQKVRTRATGMIEDDGAATERAAGEGTADAGEGVCGLGGEGGQLGGVVAEEGDRVGCAAVEVEVAAGLLGDRRIGLADVAAEEGDIEAGRAGGGHRSSLRGICPSQAQTGTRSCEPP